MENIMNLRSETYRGYEINIQKGTKQGGWYFRFSYNKPGFDPIRGWIGMHTTKKSDIIDLARETIDTEIVGHPKRQMYRDYKPVPGSDSGLILEEGETLTYKGISIEKYNGRYLVVTNRDMLKLGILTPKTLSRGHKGYQKLSTLINKIDKVK